MASPQRAAAAGFTLVELALVVGVIGLLIWTLSSSHRNFLEVDDRQAGVRHGAAVRDAIRAFSLNNARLPCPDTSGDGRAQACASSDEATGWVPYETLDMAVPDAALRAFYGVYRNAGADADLAVADDRSGNAKIDATDLVIGLNNAAQEPLDSGRIYLTGDDAQSGPIDCAKNAVRHVVYFIVVPLADRDGDGSRFDSVHTGVCAYAPATGATDERDDVVKAPSFARLSGWLRAQ